MKNKIEVNLNKINQPYRRFIKQTIKLAKKNNVRLSLLNERQVEYDDNGGKCNGFFCGDEDSEGPQLAVATKQPFKKWFSVFIHEAAHMDQWLEKDPLWDGPDYGGEDGGSLIELWLSGHIQLNESQLKQYMADMRDVEVDCEKRTVQKILKEKLPMSTDYYTQRANSYLWFYTYMIETRKWYTIGKEPYNTPEIVEEMSTEFARDYNRIPQTIKAIFNAYMKY